MEMLIDTHAHIDGEEFKDDLPEVIERAKAAGIGKIFVPAINLEGMDNLMAVCHKYPGYAYPMIGLHPEDVKDDYQEVIDKMKAMMTAEYIAIGEVGLDFYWSREYQQQQLDAFEAQVKWAVECQLPLMLHCRKAQNEMVAILRKYADKLCGGVFHCFTGNQKEAAELLAFDGFVLGIGGVLTFKSSHLREDLPAVVPLDRIVLETDCPYMAPVPNRGKRNESSYVPLICQQLAESYGVTAEEVAATTTATALRVMKVKG